MSIDSATPQEWDALSAQVGGSHYKDMAIQPAAFIHCNGIGYFEGIAISYLARWKRKGGIDDLRKARHSIDLLIQMETANDYIVPADFKRADHA